jgi:adenylate cyclase
VRGDFHVGPWLVQPQLHLIRQQERQIRIEPKAMQVLLCLAENPGEVVDKRAVKKRVWADTYVTDDVLTRCVSELRKAFEDDAKDPRVIETIQRGGYRLVAPVSAVDADQDKLDQLHSAATAAAPPVRTEPSVAVLAFSDMSPERDQEHFCDGIAEEIINNLCRVKGLLVAARTSSFAFKGRSEDIRRIGASLGVSAVLEGSVRKAGGRLRISAQLVSVSDGYHLWSERYDRALKDVFAIQEEIAGSIAAALSIQLSAREKEALGRTPTSDVEAYDYYLRGRRFYYRYSKTGAECALRMFFQAIEIDPNFARAWAGVADSWAYLYLNAGRHESHRDEADAASRKALELDPESAEAHASRGTALALKGENEAAEKAFEESIRLNPGLYEAYYFYARTCFAQGKLEKAIEFYEKSSLVNPEDYQAPLLVAQSYADLGRPAEAEAARRRGVRLAEERLKLYPDDTRALYMGANGLVALGKCEQGLEWARQAESMDPNEPMLLYNVACIQSLAGHTEEALGTLERAVENGLKYRAWLEHDSNLDPLRDSPRFKRLMDLLAEPPQVKSGK